MATTKISAAVSLACRDTALAKDSVLRNMFVQKSGTNDPIAVKRPALHTSLSMPSIAETPAHGLHYRKNTIGMSGPPDFSGNLTGSDLTDSVYVYEANYKGQFVCGGRDICYAENNNSNNWSFGSALASTSDYITDAVYDKANGGWIAVTKAGRIYTAADSDLSTWTDQGAVFSTAGYGVAYAKNASSALYVAVGSGSSYIYSSTDGITWTARTSANSVQQNAVTSNDDSYFVAVGVTGSIQHSSDGITWTADTSVGSYTWNAITCRLSSGTKVWIAVGNSGKIMRATGNTPTSWTEISSGVTSHLHAVYAVEEYIHDDLSVDFVAVGDGGTILYSEDEGATWTAANWPEETQTPFWQFGTVGPIAVNEGYTWNAHSYLQPESKGFVAFYIFPYYVASPEAGTTQAVTSLDGKNWFVGNRYNQFYRSNGLDITVRAHSENSSHTEQFDTYDSSKGYSNSAYDTYNRTFFAEMPIANNNVLGMLLPGDGTYHGVDQYFSKGSLAFCVNNSRPIHFHGYGSDTDTTIMTYPFNFLEDSSEYLVQGLVALDGYFFYMTNYGNIYHCENGNWRKWPALNVVNAELEGDEGRGISKHHNHILAFGQYTIEVFYNAGNPSGSVLNRREDIRYEVGLAAPNTMVDYSEATTFIGQTKDYVKGVYLVDNFRLTKISDVYVDNIINTYLNWTNLSTEDPAYLRNAFATIVEHNGHAFYVLTMIDSSDNLLTLAYDFVTGLWHHWYVQDKATTGGATWSASTTAQDFLDALDFVIDKDNTHYIMDSGGTIYQFDKSAYQDYSSNPIECVWQSGIFEYKDVPSKVRKRFNHAWYSGDQTTASQTLSLQWTDDDYQTFNTSKSLDIGTAFPVTHRLGMGRRRAFRTTYTGNTDFRFNGIEIDFEAMRY